MLMLLMMMMLMLMMMMMLCKSRAQVRDLCVEINNFKLPVMQTTPIFTTFSARRKMAAEKRGQIKVFGRNITNIPLFADEIPIFFYFHHRPHVRSPMERRQVPKVGSPLLSPDSLRPWAAGVKGLAERNIGIPP